MLRLAGGARLGFRLPHGGQPGDCSPWNAMRRLSSSRQRPGRHMVRHGALLGCSWLESWRAWAQGHALCCHWPPQPAYHTVLEVLTWRSTTARQQETHPTAQWPVAEAGWCFQLAMLHLILLLLAAAVSGALPRVFTRQVHHCPGSGILPAARRAGARAVQAGARLQCLGAHDGSGNPGHGEIHGVAAYAGGEPQHQHVQSWRPANMSLHNLTLSVTAAAGACLSLGGRCMCTP